MLWALLPGLLIGWTLDMFALDVILPGNQIAAATCSRIFSLLPFVLIALGSITAVFLSLPFVSASFDSGIKTRP